MNTLKQLLPSLVLLLGLGFFLTGPQHIFAQNIPGSSQQDRETVDTGSLLDRIGGSRKGGITNPAIGNLGNSPTQAATGTTFVRYVILIWQAIITVGGLTVLLMFVWGAIEWISAGGDSGKIEKARNKMTQAVIGMIILTASFTIIGFISGLFFPTFNLLELTFPTP